MTRLRLILISCAFACAVFIGAVGSFVQGAPNAAVTDDRSNGLRAAERIEVAPLVERLSATGLFPAVEPPSQIAQSASVQGASSDNTAVALPTDGVGAEVAVRPGVAALVRRGDAWSIYANGIEYVRSSLSVGDELYDGWIVRDIGASRFVIERGEETQEVNVFKVDEDA